LKAEPAKFKKRSARSRRMLGDRKEIIYMPLINLVIILVVIGVILWVINSYIPMQSNIKQILNAVVVIGVIIWLLSVFGVIGNISAIRIGK
jgi:cation transporter-like permease